MSFDFDCSCYRQLLDFVTDDVCTIEFNGSIFQVKTAAAFLCSSKIYSCYKLDPTTKKFVIGGSLKNNDNMKLIEQFFTSGKIQTEFSNEILFDLLQFALSFEFKELRSYIGSYFKSVEITFENYAELMKTFQIDEDLFNILADFMLGHFHEKSNEILIPIFVGLDEKFLTTIFTSPKLKVRHEKQVALFFIELSEQKPEFIKYFKLIHLEWLPSGVVGKLLKIYETAIIKKSESYFHKQLKLMSEMQPKYYGIKYPRTFAKISEKHGETNIGTYFTHNNTYKNVQIVSLEVLSGKLKLTDENATSGSNYCYNCFTIDYRSDDWPHGTYQIRYIDL